MNLRKYLLCYIGNGIHVFNILGYTFHIKYCQMYTQKFLKKKGQTTITYIDEFL